MITKDDYSPATLDAIRNLHVWQLADMAGVSQPTNDEAAGTVFLDCVRANFVDAIEGEWYDIDARLEIGDEAPDVYTHRRMQEFTDLAAWQVDVTEYVDPSRFVDVVDLAGIHLAVAANNLLLALENMLEIEV